ncbi:hypothetical protein B0H67DRAFT_7932 [Lasiosphaeris hirsuta]|uniref:Uncharacterized protein n=1 Tax=Lasiosphaeris hirsuta TaxID=260670 RepID=A0AA40B8W5_9PEZI|nr:hypothetical protein B0H67DRAFT_7932 [Lasiosphaeris hirsuta]
MKQRAAAAPCSSTHPGTGGGRARRDQGACQHRHQPLIVNRREILASEANDRLTLTTTWGTAPSRTVQASAFHPDPPSPSHSPGTSTLKREPLAVVRRDSRKRRRRRRLHQSPTRRGPTLTSNHPITSPPPMFALPSPSHPHPTCGRQATRSPQPTPAAITSSPLACCMHSLQRGMRLAVVSLHVSCQVQMGLSGPSAVRVVTKTPSAGFGTLHEDRLGVNKRGAGYLSPQRHGGISRDVPWR